ncbi:HEAT repeat domain-containing protein [Streptomyces sp. NPDC053431]|uniref:HEAT repeat domain-containing protein n=1 Tax=Streptomyces sp. NPDC053431 TaxID=3365703 RepID=UPI0037D4FAFA
MKGLFRRWLRGPGGLTAEGATAAGNITLISHVEGSVTLVDAPPPAVPAFDEALARYAALVRQRYGRLDLDVLTPLHEQDEHPAVRLRDVFVPQTVRADPPPVELPQELLRRLMDPRQAESLRLPPGVDQETVRRIRQAYQARPPLPVLDVLAGPGHDRLVVLGHPGAGKSTLARYLALALTGDEPPAALRPLRGRVPLIVELRDYAQAAWRERGFEDFLEHRYATEGLGLPRALLTPVLEGTGPRTALVVFDGLDEVFDPGLRDTVARRIAGFAARHPSARIVVTSRGYGYQRAVLDGAGFADVMLQDLEREQIGSFTARWFSLSCPDDPGRAARLTERVLSAVDGSRSVRELAGNPLILTILAIIGRRRELPRDRRAVYEHAVAVLVEHWDPGKYLKDRRVEEHLPYLGAEDRLELLRLIARRMQEGHGGIAGNHIAGPDLIGGFEDYLKGRYELPADRAVLAARVMLDQFRHRNFVLSRFGGEVYGFVHRTFLEYLAAADIAHRFHQERSLSQEELQELFATKAEDPAWHETLLLLVGMLDERFVAGVVERLLAPRVPARRLASEADRAAAGLPFAARCLAEVRRPGLLAAQTTLLVDRLIRLLELCREYREGFDMRSPGLEDVAAALRGLGERAPRRFLEWHDDWCRGNEGRGPRAVSLGVGSEAAEIRLNLLRGGPEPWHLAVRRLAVESPDPCTRWVAAWTASEEGLPGAPELLRDRAGDDPHPAVRAVVTEEIGYDPEPGPETVSFLLGRLRTETDPAVRRAVFASLTRTALEAPEARAWLLGVLRDGDAEARVGIADGITLDQVPDPEIRALMIRIARDGGPGECRSALRSLAFTPDRGDDPELLAIALSRAGDPRDSGVRLAALDALAGLAERHEGARAAVLRGARYDPDPQIRARTVEIVGRWRISGGDVRDLLLDRARHDGSPEVRAAALHAYGLVHTLRVVDVAAVEVIVGRAWSDASPAVRRAAGEALFALDALTEVAAPELLAVARRLAVEDASPEVRAAMLGVFMDRADRADGADRADRAGQEEGADGPGGAEGADGVGVAEGADGVGVAVRGERVDRSAGSRLVRARAVDDPSPEVRAAALGLLREGRRDLDTLTLARDRAESDEDPEVRQTALRVLGDLGRDDPRTLDLLRRAVDRDGSADVRGRAAGLLGILERGSREQQAARAGVTSPATAAARGRCRPPR